MSGLSYSLLKTLLFHPITSFIFDTGDNDIKNLVMFSISHLMFRLSSSNSIHQISFHITSLFLVSGDETTENRYTRGRKMRKSYLCCFILSRRNIKKKKERFK